MDFSLRFQALVEVNISFQLEKEYRIVEETTYKMKNNDMKDTRIANG